MPNAKKTSAEVDSETKAKTAKVKTDAVLSPAAKADDKQAKPAPSREKTSVKTEPAKATAPKAEAHKPAAAKTDAHKPASPKTDAHKPAAAKTDAHKTVAKLDAHKPVAKPEAPKAAAPKAEAHKVAPKAEAHPREKSKAPAAAAAAPAAESAVSSHGATPTAAGLARQLKVKLASVLNYLDSIGFSGVDGDTELDHDVGNMVRDAEADLRQFVEPEVVKTAPAPVPEPVKVVEAVKAAPLAEPVKAQPATVKPVEAAKPAAEVKAAAPAPSAASSSLVSRGPDPKAAAPAPSAANSSLVSRGPDPKAAAPARSAASASLVSRGPDPKAAAPAPSAASSSLVSRGPDPKTPAPSAASSSLVSRGPDPRASNSLVSRGPAPEQSRRPSQQQTGQPAQARHSHIQAQPARPNAPQQRAPVPQPQAPRPVVISTGPDVHLKPPYIVRYVAESLGMKPNDLISDLMKTMKVFVSITQALDQAKVEAYLALKGKKLIADRRDAPAAKKEPSEAEPVIPPEEVKHPEKPEDRVPRAPIVAVMGHVDHGKTTLLDALRKTTVAAGESGSITQHTGASVVERKVHGIDYKVTFIDTPGHAAFSNMRKRGATTTDVCVLIVAADDGVNAQTKEALKIIQEAKTPFVICITKMDLANANSDRCMQQLQSLGLLTEEWGGDIGCTKVSARSGLGLDDLIERICLEAEVQEVKGNPKIPGKAIVLEAELEPGQGPTANIIVRDGTIRPGDFVICGEYSGKVKALVNAAGTRIKEAGPSIPCKLLGLDGVPDVGATLVVIKDEKEARRIAEVRRDEARSEKLARGTTRVASMADLMTQVEENAKRTMRVLIKTDVRGTGEAIVSELEKIPTDKVNLEIIGNSVGSISESDVQLAGGAGATILGFHVRVNPGVNKAAAAAKIEVKLYSIIYELLDDVRAQMTGLLTKLRKEVPVGKAEIMQVFFVKAGKICGSVVRQGKVKTNAQARVIRNREIIFNGAVKNLKRFKDDVKEVSNGVECGVLLNNFNDFEVGDIIEVYEYEEIAQSL